MNIRPFEPIDHAHDGSQIKVWEKTGAEVKDLGFQRVYSESENGPNWIRFETKNYGDANKSNTMTSDSIQERLVTNTTMPYLPAATMYLLHWQRRRYRKSDRPSLFARLFHRTRLFNSKAEVRTTALLI